MEILLTLLGYLITFVCITGAIFIISFGILVVITLSIAFPMAIWEDLRDLFRVSK
uniref:hypothetical protein n=1 Tax=Ornithobacterium rhinotracheale TaxID=28251 RepID=UPI0013E2CC53|nr:hypothetical protein [Ornithobacterium rhinotracheale]